MAYVPNTDTFSLQDVVDVIGPTLPTLQSCINDSDDNYWDNNYKESKDQLDDFRNYDTNYQTDWLGYINWAVDYIGGYEIYFVAHNVSNDRYGQSSTLYWQAYLAGSPIGSGGSVASGSLNGGNYSYPSDYWGGDPYDEIRAFVSGGPVVVIY